MSFGITSHLNTLSICVLTLVEELFNRVRLECDGESAPILLGDFVDSILTNESLGSGALKTLLKKGYEIKAQSGASNELNWTLIKN